MQLLRSQFPWFRDISVESISFVLQNRELTSLEGFVDPRVEELDVSNNRLTSLDDLNKLTRLKWVSLRGNFISTASVRRVRALLRLRWLDLSSNSLSGGTMPFSEEWPQLRWADVSQNQLTHLVRAPCRHRPSSSCTLPLACRAGWVGTCSVSVCLVGGRKPRVFAGARRAAHAVAAMSRAAVQPPRHGALSPLFSPVPAVLTPIHSPLFSYRRSPLS